MMIPILKDYYAAGYLPDPDAKSIPPYLPNANLAIRRKTYDDINGYDEDCVAGEDADFCMRAARSGWAQYFDPSALTFHEPRANLLGLIRQWIWYGHGGSHLFFKQQRKRLEIYLSLDLTPKMYRYRRVFSSGWFPVPAILFVSPFVLIHLSIVLGLLALAMNFPLSALSIIALGTMGTICLYLKSTLRRLNWKELFLYAGVTYLINWTCILASFAAGLKERRIFVYPGV
jgi:cellulose synthase/poly-beta-1,6-N-acetylglucosamine synthase-like glycosyltransferase